jgi:hypothetical protein
MEKKWDTVTPADLKRLFVSGKYVYPAVHERVNWVFLCEKLSRQRHHTGRKLSFV